LGDSGPREDITTKAIVGVGNIGGAVGRHLVEAGWLEGYDDGHRIHRTT
jgi:predicted dinucleotide-binding enzyme